MKTVLVHPERCVGCRQCQVACAVEHSQSKDLHQAVYETPTPRSRIHVAPGMYLNTSFPNKCRHCNPAPCLEVCPTGAISRDSDSDIVMIDGNQCITCAMCAMACPFDVIRFYEAPTVRLEKAVALKCDNCVERQREGRVSACVEVCKVDALVFGDVNQLAKTATARLAKTVSVAAGALRSEMPRLPETYEAWRNWGEDVGQVNER